MDTGHQMHQEQRVGGAQPQGGDLRDAAAARQSRCGPDDQTDPDQYDEPVAQHGPDNVFIGQLGDPATDPEEQRPVRSRGLPPQTRNRQRENVIEPKARRRSDLVGVQPDPGDLALCQVGVDVLAVHRRCDQQRHHPHQQRPVQLAARHPARAENEATEHQPGQRHHHRAGGRHGQRDGLNAGRQIEQPHPEGRVLHHRSGAGPQRPDTHQDGAGGAEQPGPVHGPQFGRIER